MSTSSAVAPSRAAVTSPPPDPSSRLFYNPPASLRLILLRSIAYPVQTAILAATVIQRWWRRSPHKGRVCEARRAYAYARNAIWQHPYDEWMKYVDHYMQIWVYQHYKRRVKHIASRFFLLTGQHHTTPLQHAQALNSPFTYLSSTSSSSSASLTTPIVYTHLFLNFCASLIQRCWLHHRYPSRRHYRLRRIYTLAAITIQRKWREFHARYSVSSIKQHHIIECVKKIQRMWRRFVQRRIYFYFRTLIYDREHCNPYLLLRYINPKESILNDRSSGLYLRFRLGGHTFPPLLYYKIYTNLNVCDVGAFAPRNYALDRRLPTTTNNNNSVDRLGATDINAWYQRIENNGWRLCTSIDAMQEHDAVTTQSHAVKKTFHPIKVVRQLDCLKKRKKKKIQWLQKLYANGLAQVPNKHQPDEQKQQVDSDHDNNDDLELNDADESFLTQADEELHDPLFPPSPSRSYARSPTTVLDKLSSMNINDTNALLLNEEWELEAQELVQWTKGLDFDSYIDNWSHIATSQVVGNERVTSLQQEREINLGSTTARRKQAVKIVQSSLNTTAVSHVNSASNSGNNSIRSSNSKLVGNSNSNSQRSIVSTSINTTMTATTIKTTGTYFQSSSQQSLHSKKQQEDEDGLPLWASASKSSLASH